MTYAIERWSRSLNSTDMKRSTPKTHRKSTNLTIGDEPDALSTLAIKKSESSRNVDFVTPSLTPITHYLQNSQSILQ